MIPSIVLDPRVLDALRALGAPPGSLLREMAVAFLLEAPVAIAEMVEAVGEGDRGTVAFSAHKLRGTSGHLGATRLTEVCATLERAALHGDGAPMEALLGPLRHEGALAIQAAQGLMGGP